MLIKNFFNFNNVTFPVQKRTMQKIEKQNNVSTNVFVYEDETPYGIYTSKQTFEKQVDLVLLSNSKNFHYFLIKGFIRFITNKTKHH